LNSSKPFLFPPSIQEQRSLKRNAKMPKVNGGWSDKRDHILCLSHSDISMKPPVIDIRGTPQKLPNTSLNHINNHIPNEEPTSTPSSHHNET
jgi:hypothetical protein